MISVTRFGTRKRYKPGRKRKMKGNHGREGEQGNTSKGRIVGCNTLMEYTYGLNYLYL